MKKNWVRSARDRTVGFRLHGYDVPTPCIENLWRTLRGGRAGCGDKGELGTNVEDLPQVEILGSNW